MTTTLHGDHKFTLTRLCWYAAEKYLRDLKAKEEFPLRILDGIEALADFLVAETRTMERGTDAAKRQAKEEVPGDRVKDPHALARELRWRVRHATGYSSDDESRNYKKGRGLTNSDHAPNGVAPHKRKRTATDGGDEDTEIFRHFSRPGWDRVEERPTETESVSLRARRPDLRSDSWIQDVVDGKEADDEEGEDAQVIRRRDVIVKVRRTATGLERQRVERVLEEWTWTGPTSTASPSVKGKEETVDDGPLEGKVPSGEPERMEVDAGDGPGAGSAGSVAVEGGN